MDCYTSIQHCINLTQDSHAPDVDFPFCVGHHLNHSIPPKACRQKVDEVLKNKENGKMLSCVSDQEMRKTVDEYPQYRDLPFCNQVDLEKAGNCKFKTELDPKKKIRFQVPTGVDSSPECNCIINSGGYGENFFFSPCWLQKSVQGQGPKSPVQGPVSQGPKSPVQGPVSQGPK